MFATTRRSVYVIVVSLALFVSLLSPLTAHAGALDDRSSLNQAPAGALDDRS